MSKKVEMEKRSYLTRVAEDTFSSCLKILEAKNHDYSKGDDEFRNFKMIGVLTDRISVEDGILVRISDKIARIANLMDGTQGRVLDEKLEDTIRDAINYLVILLAYLSSVRLFERGEKI